MNRILPLILICIVGVAAVGGYFLLADDGDDGEKELVHYEIHIVPGTPTDVEQTINILADVSLKYGDAWFYFDGTEYNSCLSGTLMNVNQQLGATLNHIESDKYRFEPFPD